MVLDTSAVLAILFGEPAAPDLEAAIEADPIRLMSAASALQVVDDTIELEYYRYR